MDNLERSELEATAQHKRRRLQLLQRRAGISGIDTPPEVTIEIEDIEAELAELQQRLGAASSMLPDYTYDFVGRARESAQLISAFQQAAVQGRTAVASIHGMGGIGKTQLALCVAHSLKASFPDAQILLDLRGAGTAPMSATLALQTVIRVFNLGAALTDELPRLREIYRATLAGKRVLIIADDAEDADHVNALIPPPGCALLVTSRQRFAIDGTLMPSIVLDRLDPAEAHSLLLGVCPRIDAAADHLARICGYLPLALRVIANLLAVDLTKDPTVLLQDLADKQTQLARLAVPNNNELAIEEVLAIGYQALSPAAQTMLRQLSVFPTSFDLAAVEAVVKLNKASPTPAHKSAAAKKARQRAATPQAQEIEHEPVLLDLYLRSWVEFDGQSKRYMLHDVVRSFAATRLTPAEQRRFREHARYYLGVLRKVNAQYDLGGEQVFQALQLFDRERIHIDVARNWALTHKDGALVIAYTYALTTIDNFRYHLRNEILPYMQQALSFAQRLNRRNDEMEILYHLGGTYVMIGEKNQANKYDEQALNIAIARHQRLDEARILVGQMEALIDIGKPRKALENGRTVQQIMHEVHDRLDIERRLYFNFGKAYFALGEIQHAIRAYEQALEISYQQEDIDGTAVALGNLGRVYISLGDVDRALALCKDAVEFKQALGDRNNECIGLHYLGLAHALSGNLSEAYQLQQQALSIAREVTNEQAIGQIHNALGELALREGDLARAITEFEQAVQHAQKHELIPDASLAAWNLGRVHEQQGQLEQAAALLKQRVEYERRIRHAEYAEHAAYLAQLRQRINPDEPPELTAMALDEDEGERTPMSEPS